MNDITDLKNGNSRNDPALALSLSLAEFQPTVIALPAGDNLLPSPAFKADGTSLAELTLKFLQSALPHRSFTLASLDKLLPSDILLSQESPAPKNATERRSLVRKIIHSAFDNAPGIGQHASFQAYESILEQHFASEKASSPIGLTPDIQLVQADIIHGTPIPQAPSRGLSLTQRKQRLEAYAQRVRSSLARIERGSEAQRNACFMTLRPFLEPEGYLSAGLLAANLDPHDRTSITYTSTVKSLNNDERIESRYERIYAAWEIAAGRHKHDEPDNSGSVLNYHYEGFKSAEDRQKVKDLEALNPSLTDHWQRDVLAALDTEREILARRSGKADAYQAKALLASLRRATEIFRKTTPAAQKAVARTLDENGQVIIPNIYGYALSGCCFVPYQPYEKKDRPNQGLMLDLLNATLDEIDGDDEFAQWASKHLEMLLQRFNSLDAQGGRDAHWPSAPQLLDTLINAPTAHLERPVFQGSFAVRKAFNYTGAAASGYQLKYAPLSDIDALYAKLNARNVRALDQTLVFNRAQQKWKTAREFWSSTFGYIPIVGNAGNIVFAIHDAETGMSADERLGASAAILISTLQLAHDLAFTAASAAVEASHQAIIGNARRFAWESTPRPKEFRVTWRASDSENVSIEPVLGKSRPGVGKPGIEILPVVSHPAAVSDATIVARVSQDGVVIELDGKSYIRLDTEVFETRSSLVGPKQRTVIDQQTASALFYVQEVDGKWQRVTGLQGGGQCFGSLCQTTQGELEMELQPMQPSYSEAEPPSATTTLFALSREQRLTAFADEADNLASWLMNVEALAEFKAIYTRERPNPQGFWAAAQSYTDWQAIVRLVRDDASLLPLQDTEHALPNEMLENIRQKFISPPHPSLLMDDAARTRALFNKILVPPTYADDLAYVVEDRAQLAFEPGQPKYLKRIMFKYGLTARQLRQYLSGMTRLRNLIRSVIDERYPGLKERANMLFDSYEFDLREPSYSHAELDQFFGWLEDESIPTEKFRLIVQSIDADRIPVTHPEIYTLDKTRKIAKLNTLTEKQLQQNLEGASTVVERSSPHWDSLEQRDYIIEHDAAGEPVSIINWSFFKLKRTPVLKEETGALYVKERWWPDLLGKRYATFNALEQDLQHQLGGREMGGA